MLVHIGITEKLKMSFLSEGSEAVSAFARETEVSEVSLDLLHHFGVLVARAVKGATGALHEHREVVFVEQAA